MQHCWFVVGGSGDNTFPISLEATLDHGLQTGCVLGLLNKSDHFNWKNHTEPFSLQRHLPSGWSWGSKDLWGHVSQILLFLSLRHIKLNPNLIKLVSLEQMPYMHYKTNCFNKQKSIKCLVPGGWTVAERALARWLLFSLSLCRRCYHRHIYPDHH